MLKLRGLLLLAIGISLIGYGTAFADAGADGSSGGSVAPFYPLIAVAIGLLAAVVRGQTVATGFWHQWYGHLLLVLAGSVLGALGPVFDHGIVTKATLISALAGGLTAFAAALKPVGKDAGGAAAALLPLVLVALAINGCATIYTPPGATTARKLKDDLSAIGIVEADVKAQCGANFAPLGAQVMAGLSIAEAAGNAAAYNIGGAVQMGAQAFPVIAGDVQGLICVYKVVQADYQRLKPKAAPPTPGPAPTTTIRPAVALRDDDTIPSG